MKEQTQLFEHLKSLKDYWVESALENLDPSTDLSIFPLKNDYELLQSVIDNDELQTAYKNVTNDLIEGFIHSLLVMFDGGSELPFPIDLIHEKSKKSLKNDIFLHEEFFAYLLDNEED